MVVTDWDAPATVFFHNSNASCDGARRPSGLLSAVGSIAAIASRPADDATATQPTRRATRANIARTGPEGIFPLSSFRNRFVMMGE